MTTLSAKQKMLNALKEQQTFTVAQGRARFGVANIPARIEELRKEGHCIYTGRRRNSEGKTVNYYTMGPATKSLVQYALAAGYSFSRRSNGNPLAA
jgi:hypothetical protein